MLHHGWALAFLKRLKVKSQMCCVQAKTHKLVSEEPLKCLGMTMSKAVNEIMLQKDLGTYGERIKRKNEEKGLHFNIPNTLSELNKEQ